MFNDVLSLSECEGLVGELAGCVFPFVCAHGRVGVVPVVEIGVGEGEGFGRAVGQTLGLDESVGKPGEKGDDESFAQAFRLWKERGGGGVDMRDG